ncbi:ATP-grasp fold amidoligase family protein [Aerococcaceae bacterium WGS1372]
MIYNIKKKIRRFSQKNKIIGKIYNYLNKLKVNSLSRMSDEKFAKMKYYENTGRKLNLTNPTTFNEKLWWLKINNRDPLLTTCSDKVEVRDYLIKKGFEDILIPQVGVYSNPKDLEFDKFPDEVFIKTSHGSGRNLIWRRNSEFDYNKFNKEFESFLKQNYYLQSREWNYKNIEPKIVVEEIIKDDSELGLVDYRFLCFDGKVKLILVDTETAASDGTHSPGAKRNVYNQDFELMDIKVSREHFNHELISKPKNFEKMIEISESLSDAFEFCRVDLYNIKGKIYFGEITFYTGGATQIIEPEKWEQKLGSWINLDSDKIVRKL